MQLIFLSGAAVRLFFYVSCKPSVHQSHRHHCNRNTVDLSSGAAKHLAEYILS